MSTPARMPPTLGPRLFLAALTAAVVVALTLAPRAVVAPVRGAVMALAGRFAEPLVAGLSPLQLESALNALLFVPLGAALALLLGRRLWALAPVLGFAVSFAVEYAQVRIPGRVPDLQDVVWNTVGAVVGAAAVGVVLAGVGSRRSGCAGLRSRWPPGSGACDRCGCR
ncbi:VanZ family protein [Microbacterium jejuense]|uniref:VanZ family protein n=1 Tax=Microbacterium jejuense TaxID=1263637 RepID=UPI0031E509FF